MSFPTPLEVFRTGMETCAVVIVFPAARPCWRVSECGLRRSLARSTRRAQAFIGYAPDVFRLNEGFGGVAAGVGSGSAAFLLTFRSSRSAAFIAFVSSRSSV